jgi:hypothetical protein
MQVVEFCRADYLNTPEKIGATMVHEMGHYVFGLYDEYREVGRLTGSPSQPQDGDTPRNTLMHNQNLWSNFSTANDYEDPSQRQTAQYRWYSSSAWETLVRNPAADGELAKPFHARTWFEPFKNMQAPTTLTSPVNSAEARKNLSINYVSGTNIVLVLDLAVSQDVLAGLKDAAKAVLDAASDNTNFSLITFINSNYSDAGTPYFLGVNSAYLGAGSNRTVIRNYIESRQAYTSGSLTNTLDLALAKAATVVSPLASAQDTAKTSNQPIPPSYSIPITRTPIIQLLTTSNRSVSDETKRIISDGSVLLNVQTKSSVANLGALSRIISYPAAASTVGNLEAISTESGGRFFQAKSSSELVKNATNAANEGEGEPDQIMTTVEGELAAGASLTMTTPISNATDRDVTISGYYGDNTGIASMTLVGPGPITYGPINITTDDSSGTINGISYQITADSGVISFTIPDNLQAREGIWTSTMTASSQTSEEVALESTVKSSMTIESFFSGGTATDHDEPVITTVLKQPDAVKMASVSADIYDANEQLVQSSVTLSDNGIFPDRDAGDGIYSAKLDSFLTSSGLYFAVISVSNRDGAAKYGSSGSLQEGYDLPDVPIPSNFVRLDEFAFTYSKPDVSAAVEDGVPSANGSGTGDGNGDGIPDSQQNNVTSLPAASGGAGAYETIESTGGITLNGVSTTTSPSGLPSGISTPFGALSFIAAPVTPGATESFKLYLPYTPSINAAYKLNQTTGVWMNVATSITSYPAGNPTKTVISFSLKDGGPFDADRLANGSISDPIIPAIYGGNIVNPRPNPIPTLSDWAQLFMMLLMLASVQVYGRKLMN